LERVGLIELWSDDRIPWGGDWEAEIGRAIARARVAILLVSANSLTSDFILQAEVPALLARREKEGLVVVPVIAKPCAWQSVDWLSRMNVVPRGARPVWGGGGGQADAALALIAEEVATLVRSGASAG